MVMEEGYSEQKALCVEEIRRSVKVFTMQHKRDFRSAYLDVELAPTSVNIGKCSAKMSASILLLYHHRISEACRYHTSHSWRLPVDVNNVVILGHLMHAATSISTMMNCVRTCSKATSCRELQLINLHVHCMCSGILRIKLKKNECSNVEI
jgi:hypothetical protein